MTQASQRGATNGMTRDSLRLPEIDEMPDSEQFDDDRLIEEERGRSVRNHVFGMKIRVLRNRWAFLGDLGCF